MCLCAGANLCVRLAGDLTIPGDKIGMQMGVENVRQRDAKIGRGMQIPVHIAERIDQNPLFGFMRADQICRVAESSVYKRFDEIGFVCHGLPVSWLMKRALPESTI